MSASLEDRRLNCEVEELNLRLVVCVCVCVCVCVFEPN